MRKCCQAFFSAYFSKAMVPFLLPSITGVPSVVNAVIFCFQYSVFYLHACCSILKWNRVKQFFCNVKMTVDCSDKNEQLWLVVYIQAFFRCKTDKLGEWQFLLQNICDVLWNVWCPPCHSRIWQLKLFCLSFQVVFLGKQRKTGLRYAILHSFSISVQLHLFHQFMCDFGGCLCRSFTGVSVEEVFLSSLVLLESRQLFSPELSTFWKVCTEPWVFCFVMTLQIWPFKLWNDVITKQTDAFFQTTGHEVSLSSQSSVNVRYSSSYLCFSRSLAILASH